MAASYPTSAKSFSARAAGQTISASHINDLQDEVAAIEAGLLNGTAPLTSSNATIPALQCTASTITTLVVSGSFTQPAVPYARVTSTLDLQIGNNAYVAFSFTNQQALSVASMHSTSSNPSRLMPPSSGGYVVGGQITWADANSSGQRLLEILLNSTVVIGRSAVELNSSVLGAQNVTTFYNCSTSDYVELRGLQDSGSTTHISVVSEYSPIFYLYRVR